MVQASCKVVDSPFLTDVITFLVVIEPFEFVKVIMAGEVQLLDEPFVVNS